MPERLVNKFGPLGGMILGGNVRTVRKLRSVAAYPQASWGPTIVFLQPAERGCEHLFGRVLGRITEHACGTRVVEQRRVRGELEQVLIVAR